jgi:hypothetical protein
MKGCTQLLELAKVPEFSELSIIEFDQPLDWITFDLSIKTYYKVIL